MYRRAAWFFVAVLASISAVSGGASAQQPEVVTVDLVEGRTDPTEPNIIAVRERAPDPMPDPVTIIVQEQVRPEPSIVVISEPYALPVDEPEEPAPLEWWPTFGIPIETIQLGALDLTFDDPEISALGTARLVPTGGWGSPVIGGVMWGNGYRPLPWLRLPEVRVGMGGGSSDGPWVPLQGVDGFEARATSIFYLRAELTAGVEARLGPIAPFLLGRVGVAAYFVDVDIQHATLGSLGTETVVRGALEAGLDAGVAIYVSDNVQLYGAWRGTFTGAQNQGVHIGISVGLDNED